MQYIAPDKELFAVKKYRYFSYFSMKIYVVGIHLKRLDEALQMSTHNIYLHGFRAICLSDFELCQKISFTFSESAGCLLYQLLRYYIPYMP